MCTVAQIFKECSSVINTEHTSYIQIIKKLLYRNCFISFTYIIKVFIPLLNNYRLKIKGELNLCLIKQCRTIYSLCVSSCYSFITPILLSVFCISSSPDGRYPSSAPNAHATHASRYGHAPSYDHDAWGSPSTWHTHGPGASRLASSWHVTG